MRDLGFSVSKNDEVLLGGGHLLKGILVCGGHTPTTLQLGKWEGVAAQDRAAGYEYVLNPRPSPNLGSGLLSWAIGGGVGNRTYIPRSSWVFIGQVQLLLQGP